MRKIAKGIIGIVFSFQMAFFILFICLVVMLMLSVKSCTDDVKERGLKNILNDTVEEYWEADSTKSDSTK